MKEKINIVHVGMSGIPFERGAAINRCLSLYAILNKNDFNVLILNHKAGLNRKKQISISKSGNYEYLNYIYTTPTAYKPNTFIKRRYYKFIGRLNEFITLFKLSSKNKIDILLYYPDGLFFDLVTYRIISKLYGTKLVSHYVEFRSSFERKVLSWKKINDVLFDKYFMYFVDGVIPISEFLFNKVKSTREDLQQLKIPPVIDFQVISEMKPKPKDENYFLYVGAAGYLEAIRIILDSFELINNNNFYLYLILHGKGLKLIKQEIKTHPKRKLIKVFSNLEYHELMSYNFNANALLIPLEDSLKDTARFPQKICEYVASKSPIITTEAGEIKYFFQDGVNALISKNYNSKTFAEKMNFVIQNPERSKEIGHNGYKIGLDYFDSKQYKLKLEEFIQSIKKKKE